MTDYNDRRSIGIGVSIDTTSIPFRYPFFKSTADTDPILSIAIGDTIGTDSATDINNPARTLYIKEKTKFKAANHSVRRHEQTNRQTDSHTNSSP